MSENQPQEGRNTHVLKREFLAELSAGDGRTVDLRIVPYGTVAEVSDGGPVYREEWAEGAFDAQLSAGHRVLLNFEHQQGIAGIIGKGVSLRSASDGLHGSFKILEGSDGDKALSLVNDGILTGVSLEAYAKKSIRTAEGVVRRVKAHLDKVALCRSPAFKDAMVLAVREEPELIIDEDLLPFDADPELIERCRKLGIKLPQRYQAHPEPDTSAESDTSADGTRQSTENTDSEE